MCGPNYSNESSGNVIVRSGPLSPAEEAKRNLNEAQHDVNYYTQRLNDVANNQKVYTHRLDTAKERLALAQENYDGIIKALDGGNV